MYLIVIVWTYVSLMMAVAEATSPVGSVLGAVITFVLYGLLPVSIIVYIFSTPVRKRMRKMREEQSQRQWSEQQKATDGAEADSAVDPHGGGQPPASS